MDFCPENYSADVFSARHKDVVRNHAMDPTGSQAYRSSMLFPGPKCLDLVRGLGLGSLNARRSRVIAVEGVAEFLDDVRSSAECAGFSEARGNFRIEHKPLTRVDLGIALAALKRERLNHAFFDLCGDLKPPQVEWLKNAAPLFSDHARVSLTARACVRKPRLLAAAIKIADFDPDKMFNPRLTYRLGRCHNDFGPAKTISERKAMDTLRLNFQLMQAVFPQYKLIPGHALIYNNRGTTSRKGQTLMTFIDTIFGGANRIKTELEAWYDRLMEVALSTYTDDWRGICAEYYGSARVITTA